MLPEKAEHLGRGIRPLWISKRTARVSPRPGMARLMDHPLLSENAAVGITVEEAGVGTAVADSFPLYRHSRDSALSDISGREPLVEQTIRVGWSNGGIAVSVKDDDRDRLSKLTGVVRCSLFHRGKRGGEIVCSSIGKARMHTHGGIKIRICRSQDSGHRSSSR